MTAQREQTLYQLGPLAAIPPGEGREFAVAGEQIAVFHTRSGKVYATQALCPHRQGPLIDGLVGGTILLCPFHAWKFNLETGEALLGQCGLQIYPVRVSSEGELVLTVEANTAQTPSPQGGEEIGASQVPVGSAVGPAISA